MVEDSHLLGYAAVMSRLLIIILSCLPLLVSAGEFYKWVDKMGVVHYSDKPFPNAEVLSLPDPVYTPAEASDPEGKDAADTGTGYSKFSLAQPEQGETIRSNQGMVNCSFFLTPGLRSGHKIVVTVDGQKLKEKLASTQFSLKDISLGTHTLKADIVDDKDQILVSTNVVSFHLRKQAISQPTPPQKPEQ